MLHQLEENVRIALIHDSLDGVPHEGMLSITSSSLFVHPSTHSQKGAPSHPSPDTRSQSPHTQETSEWEERVGGAPLQTSSTIYASIPSCLNTFDVLFPSNGFFPSPNSINEIPSDHTSLFSSVIPLNTSGAIYHGVPHCVGLRLEEFSN